MLTDPATLGLPRSPFSTSQAFAPTTQLPSPPPSARKPSLFDKEHRQDTLLAIGAGMLSGHNFGDGLGAAAQNMLQLRGNLRNEQRKRQEFGGPDDAFEIITDPQTGERTVREVPQFADYLSRKRVKPKDTADLNGRAMYALQQLPEADRPAAYRAMLANPERFGIDPDNMPAEYDPTYAGLTSNMGMTVAQANGRDQRGAENASKATARQNVQADRVDRTNIYRARSGAATAQGAERISIARERGNKVGLPKAPPKRKTASGNADLSYLLK